MKWTKIEGSEPATKVAEVPNGWLYIVEHDYYVTADGEREGYWVNGWHPPVFVPRNP